MSALARYASAHQALQTDQTRTPQPQVHMGTTAPMAPICPPAPIMAKGKIPTNARHKGTPECMMLRVSPYPRPMARASPHTAAPKLKDHPCPQEGSRGPKSATRKTQQAPEPPTKTRPNHQNQPKTPRDKPNPQRQGTVVTSRY